MICVHWCDVQIKSESHTDERTKKKIMHDREKRTKRPKKNPLWITTTLTRNRSFVQQIYSFVRRVPSSIFNDIPEHNWECLRGNCIRDSGGGGLYATDKMKCPSSASCAHLFVVCLLRCLLCSFAKDCARCAHELQQKTPKSVEIKIYGKCRHCLGTQLTLYICASISIRLNVSDVEWMPVRG